MKFARWLFVFLSLAGVWVWAQHERGVAPSRELPTWEYRYLEPQEIAVGEFKQVDWIQVTAMGDQGWELVSVTPWVLRNDMHSPRKKEGEPKLVTQSYLAYFFKRQRPPQK